MRLLKSGSIEKLEFQSFYDQNLPPYAILSHTWSTNPEEEVLYTDVISNTANGKPAFQKVQATLQQARKHDFGYCWVDTCCIDKSSSAELSEAINSMYRWYTGAAICYAYLPDVPSADTANMEERYLAFSKSRWFSRGWTLQELLSPANVEFHTQGWMSPNSLLGGKRDLAPWIADITGIDKRILRGDRSMFSASIAQRMSWASLRSTSRLEDEAYCLMGLFNVNMPMLYGEGQKAFLRLQEEIIKQSDDESIFAWEMPNADPEAYHGLLADSPTAFGASGAILAFSSIERHSKKQPQSADDLPWTMTNKGLNLTLRTMTAVGSNGRSGMMATLGCPSLDRVGFLGLSLRKIGDNQYARVNCQMLEVLNRGGTPQRLYCQQNFLNSDALEVPKLLAFKFHPITDEGGTKYEVRDAAYYNTNRENMRKDLVQWVHPKQTDLAGVKYRAGKQLFAAFLLRSERKKHQFVLLVGASFVDPRSPVFVYDALETAFGQPLEDLSRYESTQLPSRASTEKISPAVMELFKVGVTANLQQLPGGSCFFLDVFVRKSPKRALKAY